MPETSDWRFTVAPYVWGVGLSGDVGLFGREPVELDIPFSDILQNLNFAAMGVAEAHNGTWGALVDVNYTSLSASQTVSRDIGQGSIKLKAGVDVTEFLATVMGQWRAVRRRTLFSLDLMAGGRYWNVQNELSFTIKAHLGVSGRRPSS